MTAQTRNRLVAAAVFVLLGSLLANSAPTLAIAVVMHLLLLTIYLFAFEIVAVDVAAVSIMVLLGLFGLVGPAIGLTTHLVDPAHLFDGFSSNAVISIIAVMIIGAGLDKTGLMSTVAGFILRIAGRTESRIIPAIAGTVAAISSFMQNVGAAALFLPVVSRISARTSLSMSRLLMPMGFCAILGGTMTMVGSSPLILLNDLIQNSNQNLPADQQMQAWSLFSVTPVGIALVLTGIAYFVFFGRLVLPNVKESGTRGKDTMSYFRDVYGTDYVLRELQVPDGSDLVGLNLNDFEQSNRIRVIAAKHRKDSVHVGPGMLARDYGIVAGDYLGVLAENGHIEAFVEKYGLEARPGLSVFSNALSAAKSGIAEIVIPPGSSLIGKTARDVWLRKKYGLAMVALHRVGETFQEGAGIRDMPLQAGDTILGHVTWEALMRLEQDRDFVVVTTEYPKEELRPSKVGWAGLFFAIALGLVLFSDLRLSIALLTGAVGMILSGVLKIDEAYQAVSWKTVFLLASLIPLGLAVESTGTAKWIAEQTLAVVGDMPVWVIQAAVAILATFFTLVMSNVGATVLLVPLAVNIAIGVGADPAIFALTVALATSNSFLIPTHQVNALIMGPGGYGVIDFMRAGSIMTVLFLIVLMVMMSVVY